MSVTQGTTRAVDSGKWSASMRSRSVALLVVLAFVAHASVVALSLVDGLRKRPLSEGDVGTYVVPAMRLLETGHFTSRSTPPYLWEAYRTPGLPLLIALSLLLSGTPFALLFLHALSAALAALCVMDLTRRLGGATGAQMAAGLFAALLPNSLGLSGILLTDALHAHLFAAWVWALWTFLEDGKRWVGVASAVLLGALQLLRPTLVLAWLLILFVGIAVVRLRRPAAIALLLIASFIAPSYMSLRMLQDHGVWTSSFIRTAALRQYLQPRAVWLTAGGDGLAIKAELMAVDRRAAEQETGGRTPEAALYRVERRAFARYFSEHTGAVLAAYGLQFVQQLAAPQEYVFFVFMNPVPRLLRAFGSLVSVAMLLLSAGGVIAAMRSGRTAAALFVLLCAGVFWASGALSAWQGARLRLPADYALMPMAAVALERALHLTRRPAKCLPARRTA